jgi:hypothetical protein
MIGKQISPILNEIEDTLWEFEATQGLKTEYTIEGFRSGCKTRELILNITSP